MDIWSSLLTSALLLLAALGLMYWHVLSWRRAELADLAAGELDFYRRQFRRRIQTSAMLGILAVMIFWASCFPCGLFHMSFLLSIGRRLLCWWFGWHCWQGPISGRRNIISAN